MACHSVRQSQALLLLLLLCACQYCRLESIVDEADETWQSVIDPRGISGEDPPEPYSLTSHDGQAIASLPHFAALDQRCQQSLRKALAKDDAPQRLQLYPDPMHGVSVTARAHSGDVRLVFFVMASRPSAPALVSRLVRAFYHPSHLFLLHVDLKANSSVHEALVNFAGSRPNMHVLKTRRLVQWGGFSMVATLLDAISSFIDRVDFDFLINLSDADLALRTNDELVTFLRRFKGRTFMRIERQQPLPYEGTSVTPVQPLHMQRQHAFSETSLQGRTVIECGGFGFVGVNVSAELAPSRLNGGPACCVGQSGPLLHGSIPYDPPQPPRPSYGEFRGSQWSVLPSAFCKHLITDAGALQWAHVFERRLLPDEFYLPTVLMHSAHRTSLVNHNLRHEVWPVAEHEARDSDWSGAGESEWGGAQLLNSTTLRVALRSAMLLAKKVIPSYDPTLLPRYDAWMKRKLAGELDPNQPPIAAPLLRVDPELYGFGPPPLLLSLRPDHADEEKGAPHGSSSNSLLVEEGHAPQPAAEGTSHHSLSAAPLLLPPRRVVRRRRHVASLLFSDGSLCSCAPDCTPRGASDVSEEPRVEAATSQNSCCAHAEDGRQALCEHPYSQELDAAGARRADSDFAAAQERVATADAAESAGQEAIGERPAQALGHQTARPCPRPSIGVLASTSQGTQITVLFLNRAPYPIRLSYMDEAGREAPLLSLRPSEFAELDALTSHAWRVHTLSGTLLVELANTTSDARQEIVHTVHIHECDLLGSLA